MRLSVTLATEDTLGGLEGYELGTAELVPALRLAGGSAERARLGGEALADAKLGEGTRSAREAVSRVTAVARLFGGPLSSHASQAAVLGRPKA